MPVVHCTYLVRVDVIPSLTYQDDSERYEYLVFSDVARKRGITQYLDNRSIYGYILFDRGSEDEQAGQLHEVRRNFSFSENIRVC